MILADTSIWVDHLSETNTNLQGSLESGEILMHPYVLGEIALGNLHRRSAVLDELRKLPGADMASVFEVLRLIEALKLWGAGVGYVDAHLLASVRLHRETKLWTRDRRVAAVADRLGLNHRPLH